MKKLFAASLLLCSVTVLAQEWNFNEGKTSTGEVILKDEYGNDLTVNSNSGDVFSTSYSTVPLVVASGGGGGTYTIDQAIRLNNGTVAVYESGLETWINYTYSDFEAKFDYDSLSSVQQMTYDKTTHTSSKPFSYKLNLTSDGNTHTGSVDCTIDGTRMTDSATTTITYGSVAEVSLTQSNPSFSGGCVAFVEQVITTYGTFKVYIRAYHNSRVGYVKDIWYVNRNCGTRSFDYIVRNGTIGVSETLSATDSTSATCSSSSTGFYYYDNGVDRGFSWGTRNYYYSYVANPSNPPLTTHTLSTVGVTSDDKAYVNLTTRDMYYQDGINLYALVDSGSDLTKVFITELGSSADTVTGFYVNTRVAE